MMRGAAEVRALGWLGGWAVGLLVPQPLAPQLAEVPASPAIRALGAAGVAGHGSFVTRFWNVMTRVGTPLVEPADSGYSLLTFVYRGDAHTRGVRLQSNVDAVAIDGIVANLDTLGTMVRLPGTTMWQRTYRVRDDLRVAYAFEVVNDAGVTVTVIDSLNRRRHAAGTPWEASLVELAAAPARPWREQDRSSGRWVRDSLESRALGGRHAIQVYLPADHDATRRLAYPVLIASGPASFGTIIPTDRIVDHLHALGVIRPTIVVLVEDLADASDSTGYGPAVSYLADDVLPWLRGRYRTSGDPSDVIVTGGSRRGLIAATAAFRRPDAIGNALTLSGSFYWHPPGDPAFEWLPRLMAASERKPIRLYVTAGELETVVTPTNAGHYLVGTNRHLRDVLAAKGYTFGYREYYGVHGEANWEDALAEGLRWFAATEAGVGGN